MPKLKPELQDIVDYASELEMKAAFALKQHHDIITEIQTQLLELLKHDGANDLSQSEISTLISCIAERFPTSKYFNKAQMDFIQIHTQIENFLRFGTELIDWEFETMDDYKIFHRYNENVIGLIEIDNFSKFYHDTNLNLKNPQYKIFQDTISGKLDEFLERYAEKTEGSDFCADKARFAISQIIKHFENNQSPQPLSELYPKDSLSRIDLTPDTNHPTYWSWTKVKDTSELIDIIQQQLMY